MRSVVITGDDFGLSPEINRGILEAHEHGVLTAASLMAAGGAFTEAVALAKAHPRLAVGLHLVVSGERPLLPPDQIPALVDSAGRFSSALVRAGLRYRFSSEARRQLRLEIRAQLEKFRGTGLPLSHVDGHHHMHMHPVVLSALVDLAPEFGIRVIRLPSEELSLALEIDRRGLLGKTALAFVFARLRRAAERRLKPAGIRFTDRTYGLLSSGRITEEYLLGLIPRIRADCVEVYSHPVAGTGRRHPLGASPEQLAALLSDRVRQALMENRFRLATPREAIGC